MSGSSSTIRMRMPRSASRSEWEANGRGKVLDAVQLDGEIKFLVCAMHPR